MDCELLVFSKLSQESYSNFIMSIIEMDSTLIANYKSYADYISINCEYFTMIFDIDEIIGLDIVEEDFGFVANISIRIQLLRNTLDQGLNLLFKILNYIIKYADENLLLLENGSKVIIEKKNQHIYSNVNENDETKYPFHLIESEIEIR